MTVADDLAVIASIRKKTRGGSDDFRDALARLADLMPDPTSDLDAIVEQARTLLREAEALLAANQLLVEQAYRDRDAADAARQAAIDEAVAARDEAARAVSEATAAATAALERAEAAARAVAGEAKDARQEASGAVEAVTSLAGRLDREVESLRQAVQEAGDDEWIEERLSALRAHVDEAMKGVRESFSTDLRKASLGGPVGSSLVRIRQDGVFVAERREIDFVGATVTPVEGGQMVRVEVDGATPPDLSGYQETDEKDQPNGYAGLDGSGKIALSTLPASVMEYQGTWNAATNTPTLADGTGSPGDVYRVTTGGTRNLGSGAIEFEVGDYVIANASAVWERAATSDLHTAADVTFDPSGTTLTAGDVDTQSAIESLDAALLGHYENTGPIPGHDAGSIVYDDDGNVVLVGVDNTQQALDSADAALAALGTTTAGLRPAIRKTADETVNNSATMQNDNHLIVPIVASEILRLDMTLYVTAGNGTPDFDCTFDIPSGASIIFGGYGPRISANDDLIRSQGPATAAGTELSFGVPTTNAVIRIWAVVTCGATSGNITLQWAQNVAGAVDTKVLAGSHVIPRALS